ncbi:MAG: SDR family NAD(P)-dependent oxidoreductase [Candidatus Eremiobacteraeota bacterium]|nr:SDR family NAD(P)-dependent oxidoreductase [Candidatus Eremiobacteraeota bacterium]
MNHAKPYDFKGRTAVITGAASGIGRALAIALAARGAHLALVDRNEAQLAQTVRFASGSGVRISSHLVDLADASSIAALPAIVSETHPDVDIVVNNAGVALGGLFEQVEPRDFDWLFDINFWGVVRMTRAFLPKLRKSDDAVLANVSSIFGIIAPPAQTAYSASKFAVRGFSQSLRAELSGTNVAVTVIYPGGVATSIAATAREPMGTTPEQRERNKRLWQKMLRMPPEEAAAIIVRGIERRRARILVGNDAKIAAIAERCAPVSYGRLLRLLNRR